MDAGFGDGAELRRRANAQACAKIETPGVATPSRLRCATARQAVLRADARNRPCRRIEPDFGWIEKTRQLLCAALGQPLDVGQAQRADFGAGEEFREGA